MVAELIGIELQALEVEVTGDLDVRGTLMIDPAVPVGFQRIVVAIRARVPAGSPAHQLAHLAAATERCCIVLETLRHGVPVHVTFEPASLTPPHTAVSDTRPESQSLQGRHQCHSSTSS